MNQNHWANQPERGNRLALWLTTQIVRYLPPWLLPIAVSIISRYYYHTSPRARRNITRYQQRLQRTTPGLQLPKHAVYRQIRSFAEAIADRFAVWQHRLTYRDLTVHDPDNLYQRIDHPEAGARGEILLCSHHGNMEICRALVAHHRHFALNILVHHKHAEAYNRALKKAGADDIRMIQVSELDAAVMLKPASPKDLGSLPASCKPASTPCFAANKTVATTSTSPISRRASIGKNTAAPPSSKLPPAATPPCWSANAAKRPCSGTTSTTSGTTMKNSRLIHDYPHQIPFYDVDSMHIVWHGHYVKYLELARCAWLERFDYGYRQMMAGGYAWPVAQLNLKYIRPARFGQHITIRTGLREYESCLKLDYLIFDRDSGEKMAKGATMQIAVHIESGETQYQTPDDWQQRIRQALAAEAQGLPA